MYGLMGFHTYAHIYGNILIRIKALIILYAVL